MLRAQIARKLAGISPTASLALLVLETVADQRQRNSYTANAGAMTHPTMRHIRAFCVSLSFTSPTYDQKTEHRGHQVFYQQHVLD